MNFQLLTSSFKTYLASKQQAHSTIKTRQAAINIYFRWLEKQHLTPGQITYRDLLAFIKYCNKKGISKKTIQHYIGTIKHYYNHLKQQGQVHENPTTDIEIKGVKRTQLYQILEERELNQLYNDFKAESLSEQRNKVIVGLVVYQGLKSTELGKLEVNDVNMRAGEINIPSSKKNNSRTLKLQANQVMDFYHYLQEVRPALLSNPTQKLFINTSTSTNFLLIMRGVISQVKKINPQALSINQIRASVITKWLKRYNLREAQYKAGHRYISSTERYLQNDIEGLQEEVEKYHPLG
jgi:integrase/recombinase XerD